MSASTLELRIVEARLLNPLIRLLRLRADDGRQLPAYAAGAHVKVRVQSGPGNDAADWRHYSLINFSTERNATQVPVEYVIAVRLEPAGRGGSRFMHERVQQGDVLTVEVPKNDFSLHTARRHRAGGGWHRRDAARDHGRAPPRRGGAGAPALRRPQP